jgi:pimeloyl-ACP methyl ester carboxylesterase
MWVEIAAFLRASLRYVEQSTIDGVGHLLQIQESEPVARQIAQFLRRNPSGYIIDAKPLGGQSWVGVD